MTEPESEKIKFTPRTKCNLTGIACPAVDATNPDSKVGSIGEAEAKCRNAGLEIIRRAGCSFTGVCYHMGNPCGEVFVTKEEVNAKTKRRFFVF